MNNIMDMEHKVNHTARIVELEHEAAEKEHEIMTYMATIESLQDNVLRLESLVSTNDSKNSFN